ncbi:unnamed protein product [Ilex paraguariensis]|uniref:Uncharacterized protein n=1 Tax=Ilex paraguariensis TaxID=185542 RepID=A0ABC8QS90_9AQUA
MSESGKELSEIDGGGGCDCGGSGSGSGSGDGDGGGDDEGNGGDGVIQKDDQKKERENGFGNFTQRGKRVALFRLRKVKKQSQRRNKKGNSAISGCLGKWVCGTGRRRGGGGAGCAGGGGGGCYLCLKQPQTLDSPSESETSDPNNPDFTYEMCRELIEKNDFSSKEYNPQMGIETVSSSFTDDKWEKNICEEKFSICGVEVVSRIEKVVVLKTFWINWAELIFWQIIHWELMAKAKVPTFTFGCKFMQDTMVLVGIQGQEDIVHCLFLNFLTGLPSFCCPAGLYAYTVHNAFITADEAEDFAICIRVEVRSYDTNVRWHHQDSSHNPPQHSVIINQCHLWKSPNTKRLLSVKSGKGTVTNKHSSVDLYNHHEMC